MAIEFERGKTVVVDRGAPRTRAGGGLVAGLGVVWRHFRDAMTKKLDEPSEISGVFTVQYPEEREQLPETYRNFPVLLYDDASGQELCTSCFQCERICPPQVIHITQAKDSVSGKAVPALEQFVLEYDACMSCGLCAEVCPFDAIKMDHEFELSTDVHGGLTIDRGGLARPISYYAQLAPTLWAEVEGDAIKKLQGSLKRRSGLIGIAPPMRDEVRRKLASEEAARPTATPVVTAASGDPADDKAAKLAAIRAANAAKKGEAETSVAAAPANTPADDKAAKLAAIRAANAAKKANQAPEHNAADAPDVPVPSTPADEKAVRLAAIRAANAAKKVAETPPPAALDEKAARLAAIRAANAAKNAQQETNGDASPES